MACDGKTIGKPHFQHQDKANTQSRIMIPNHAARNSNRGLTLKSKNVGKPHFKLQDGANHTTRNSKERDCQNIQGASNNQIDEASKQQHNDVQGMPLKSKNIEKSHFQLQDGANTQPQILIGNYTTQNSKKRDCQNIQGASNNQIDEASKQQHNDVQGMPLKSKNIGKSHFQLQDGANTQPQILIDNHAIRNSKKKECQNIQGASNNQIDEASKQQHNNVQGMPLKSKNVGKSHFQIQDGANTQPHILIDNHANRNSKKRASQ